MTTNVKTCLVYGDGRVVWGKFEGQTVRVLEALPAKGDSRDFVHVDIDTHTGRPVPRYISHPMPARERMFKACDVACDYLSNKVIVYLEQSGVKYFNAPEEAYPRGQA